MIQTENKSENITIDVSQKPTVIKPPTDSKKEPTAKKPLSRKKLMRYGVAIFLTLVASFIYSVGLTTFIIPNNFLPSGITGIATLLAHFFPQLPVGTYLFILNVPLFIWAYRELSKRFLFFSGLCIVSQTLILNFITPYMPVYTDNTLMACLFGGVLIGIACGIVIKNYGSFGGVDLIAIILKNHSDISIGAVNIIFNIFIVGAAALIFGFERGMYTIVNIYIMAIVMDKVIEGLNRKRSATIITTQGEAVAHAINIDLHRGVTILKGEGAFTHKDRDVLICVVSRFELTPLKELIHDIDPSAFITITEAYEVYGRFVQKNWLMQDNPD